MEKEIKIKKWEEKWICTCGKSTDPIAASCGV